MSESRTPLHPDARIIVIGTSAAGKSWLACEIAKRLGVPFIELDELFWGPEWTPKTVTEFERLVSEYTEGKSWVAAGNFGVVRPLLWPRANTIIWLNYSLPVVFWRGVRRTFVRSSSRITEISRNGLASLARSRKS